MVGEPRIERSEQGEVRERAKWERGHREREREWERGR